MCVMLMGPNVYFFFNFFNQAAGAPALIGHVMCGMLMGPNGTGLAPKHDGLMLAGEVCVCVCVCVCACVCVCVCVVVYTMYVHVYTCILLWMYIMCACV